MKKLSRIALLLIVFIFLSTYISKDLDLVSEKNPTFFKIQNIEIINNFLIEKIFLLYISLSFSSISLFVIKKLFIISIF